VIKAVLSLFKPDTQTIADRQDYYPYIDGLRGIAILLVLLGHCVICIDGTSRIFLFPRIKDLILQLCSGGVYLFFMLSAFTLFSSSKRRYAIDKYPRVNFYVRRFFRIYPLFAIAIIFYSWNSPAALTAGRLVANLFFVPSLAPSLGWLMAVPVAWSLLCEETFYFLLPFIYTELKNTTQAFKFFLATCILSMVWLALAPIIGLSDAGHFLRYHPITNWYIFAGGILIYFLSGQTSFRALVLQNKMLSAPLSLFVVFVVLGSIGNTYAICLGLALLFVASIPEGTFFGMIARNKLLMRFGAYCYSIYLLHLLVLKAITPAIHHTLAAVGLRWAVAELQLLIIFPLAALACICCAFITFNLLEKPSVRCGKLLIPKINSWLDKPSLSRGGIIA